VRFHEKDGVLTRVVTESYAYPWERSASAPKREYTSVVSGSRVEHHVNVIGGLVRYPSCLVPRSETTGQG
jgi:hypothetical protein